MDVSCTVCIDFCIHQCKALNTDPKAEIVLSEAVRENLRWLTQVDIWRAIFQFHIYKGPTKLSGIISWLARAVDAPVLVVVFTLWSCNVLKHPYNHLRSFYLKRITFHSQVTWPTTLTSTVGSENFMRWDNQMFNVSSNDNHMSLIPGNSFFDLEIPR